MRGMSKPRFVDEMSNKDEAAATAPVVLMAVLWAMVAVASNAAGTIVHSARAESCFMLRGKRYVGHRDRWTERQAPNVADPPRHSQGGRDASHEQVGRESQGTLRMNDDLWLRRLPAGFQPRPGDGQYLAKLPVVTTEPSGATIRTR